MLYEFKAYLHIDADTIEEATEIAEMAVRSASASGDLTIGLDALTPTILED